MVENSGLIIAKIEMKKGGGRKEREQETDKSMDKRIDERKEG